MSENVDYYYERATEYYNKGDYSKAIECILELKANFEKVYSKDNPDYAALLNRLGLMYYNNGDYDHAKQYYLEAKSFYIEYDKEPLEYSALLTNLGLLYQDMGDYVNAEEYYLESKDIWEEMPNKEHSVYASLIHNIGSLYVDMGDYDNAEERYLESKNIRERVLGKEHFDYTISLNSLGLLYNVIGDYKQSEKYLLEAKDIREKVIGKEHPNYAATLNNLGALYHDMGDYTRAEECYLESKDILKTALGKEHLDYVKTLNNLGLLYRDMGDYTRAEECLLESKDIREKILSNMHPYYATSLNNLGLLYHDMGDYTRAEECYLESKDILKTAFGREHPNYATTLNNLGWLYNVMGDYKQSEKYLLEAKDIYEKVLGKEHPDYAATLDNLGLLYHYKGDYTRAEKCLLESKNIQERVLGKEHPNYATTLNDLGSLYRDMGDYTRAEKCLLESKNIQERVLGKEHPDYAKTLNNLGLLYRGMGDYTRVEECLLESKNIQERVLGKEHPNYATALNNLGLLYHYKGDYTRVEGYLLESKSIYEKQGKEHPGYITLLNNLYLLYLDMKEYKQAVAYKKKENHLSTSLINRIFAFLSSPERENFWNAKSAYFELSYSISWFHPIPESNVLNYNNALFTKGLLLRTANAMRDSVYSSGDQNLINQYNEFSRLRRQIGSLQQRKERNETYIKSLEDRAEELDKSLTQVSAAFREFQGDLTLNWQEVRDSIRPGEAAIEFVSFRLYDKEWSTIIYYAALVLRSGMAVPEWVPLPRCRETLLEFLKKQDEKNKEQEKNVYDENGSELYTAVWQPLEKALEGVSSVYYSPSGLLHKISFNAIPVKKGLLLMDVYDLNLVSSTREIVYRGNKPPQRPGSGVIYSGLLYEVGEDSMRREAQPYNTPDAETQEKTDPPDILRKSTLLQRKWDRLFYSEIEGKDIENILSGNGILVDLYSKEKGNKESFKNLDGKKRSILHVSTHGFFFDDIEKNYGERERLERLGDGLKVFENPLLRSGLILAGGNNAWEGKPVEGVENGILFADDVARMDLLGAQLVVLSACETALGEVNNSEGVFGLQRAFKLAGAETLIMSLWNVSDKATSILMTSFYEKWLLGKSRQEAFKEAQRQLRANPQYSSPFYWAAFVMID